MKVFISYSNQDRTLAERLFGEMHAAGAEVFQYSKTAKVGQASWKQVLTWISDSDVFIVLISKSALKSQPVEEEIEQAHYSRLKRRKPNLLVAAVIEAGADPPMLIERFARVDLLSYEVGAAELFRQLGLKRKAAAKSIAKFDPLLDLAALFSDYQKTKPGPSPVRQWSAEAAKFVADYNAAAPKEIGKEARAEHIDSILTEYAINQDHPLPLYNPTAPLPAPKLSAGFLDIEWEAVPDAFTYLVEESATATFHPAKEVYSGGDTRYASNIPDFRYYRVKAIGGYFRKDSEWSNVVRAMGMPSGFVRR